MFQGAGSLCRAPPPTPAKLGVHICVKEMIFSVALHPHCIILSFKYKFSPVVFVFSNTSGSQFITLLHNLLCLLSEVLFLKTKQINVSQEWLSQKGPQKSNYLYSY